MQLPISNIQQLYDTQGDLLGVLISPKLWAIAKDMLATLISEKYSNPRSALPEPIADWKMLNVYWDFKYPPTADVVCTCCDNQTLDWLTDEPRKFTLKACNIGGLARFECCKCKASVIKRHFKDQIKCECHPSCEL